MGKRERTNPAPGRRRAALAIGLVAVLAAAWAWWTQRPPADEAAARALLLRRTPAPSELNVVVVTLDTLRADHLGCYGHPEVQTPHIDALAEQGVLFEQATATVPLTFPSHSSMFTGQIPPTHGVRDNGGFFLEPDKVTLAERLKEAGWTTGAFVAAWVLENRWGLAQGFDHYSDRFDLSKYKVVSLGTVQKRGDEVMDDALRWIEQNRQRKFFAWIHLYDPHTPWDPPEPYKSRYPGQAYAGEVAYTDAVVGRLTAYLKEKGLDRNTVIVLTADHGESLGEHGESTHAFFVYDATTHVPFIVKTPWGDRGRAKTQVSGVDLMPTVLDLVGLPPQPGIEGRSVARAVLHPEAELGHVAYSETYFPRYHFGWQHLRALRDGREKYIDAPEPEFYDVLADPKESKNLYKSMSARAERLRLALEKLAGAGRDATPERQQMDPDTLQRLAALGYVGNAVDVDPTAVLPDPKGKIGLFTRMGAAKALASAEKHDEAIEQMRAVLAEDPAIIDGHVTLAGWLWRARRTDEAIAAFQAALALKPDHELALTELAGLYRQMGRHDAALEGYRAALARDGRKPQTWYQLATLYLDMGRVGEAEKTFREALVHNPKMGASYSSLGVIEFSRGRPQEAEALVRQALELEPEVRGGRYNLARLLELKGRADEAERLYREEIAGNSDHGKAWFNLAQLRRARGDRAGQRELLTSCVDAAKFAPCAFFLAREELQAGDLEAAERRAKEGLEISSASEVAPLGHYVLADVHNRRGQRAEAQRQVDLARRLEAALRADPLPVL
ncbi:MAG: sulfatase-like hydrolase/transferase [Vicinamibacteria bacterium]|nr:sulfatase-like hydrolase/transferase [Vicinamibacteria bacterium]